jgi:hypothetical protein
VVAATAAATTTSERAAVFMGSPMSDGRGGVPTQKSGRGALAG